MAVPLTLSSVPAQTPYVQYVSSDRQTVFPYPFEITQDSDLVVLINGVQQATDGGYTLSGQGNTTGGFLTFTVGQTAGTIITLYRNIVIARITQFAQNGTFFSANFNNEFNRIYLIMQQLQESLLPGGTGAFALMVPNSNSPQPTTLLTPASYANKYLSFDAFGNPQPALLTSSGSITQAIIAGLLSPQTSAETAAGVTAVNLQYPPGCVDRYATNATPGTTPMTAAFQAAINLARSSPGGPDIVFGATAPYVLDDVLDCTFGTGAQQYGLTFRQVGNPGFNLPSSTSCGILIKHNKYTCFDLTGCSLFNFYDLSIVTDAITYPQTCFLTARSLGAGNESNFPRFFNTRVNGSFSVSILYNYGSEDGYYPGNIWQNYATDAGASCVVITTNNLWQGNAAFMASNFVTISTGSRSSIGHTFISGDYMCANASATSDVFYIEGLVENLRLIGGWWNCSNSDGVTNGRSLMYFDTTNATAQYFTIENMHGENGVTLPNYGLDIGTTAGTLAGFDIRNCYFATNTYAICSAGTSVLLSTWNIACLTERATKGISVSGTLEDSYIDYGGTLSLATALRTAIRGSSGNISITTNTHSIIFDTQTGNIVLSGVLEVTGTQVVGAQQTTGVAAATFVQVDTTTAVSTDSTFDGYTLRQVVKALRIHGLLA